MKVCPQCGYVDRGPWRQNRWRSNVEFIHLSTLVDLDHALAEKLQAGHDLVTDQHYAYRMPNARGVRIVERVYLGDYVAGGKSAFQIPREKHDPPDPFQRRLLEATK